jgi:inosine-uridine nucleoside N-ribohydrolase
MSEKLIIDTDIGDDIDDAFALVMLSKECRTNLVGVTTVYKNGYERAQIASYLLNKMDLNIPVLSGISNPIREPFRFLPFEQKTDDVHISQLTEMMKHQIISDHCGVDFILDCADRYGEDLTLLAIGPLTNLATAYIRNPNSFKKIGKIIVMGGSFKDSFPEWNVRCDPEAFDYVLQSQVKLQFVGIDVTKMTSLSKRDLQQICQLESEPLKLLSELTNLYIKNYHGKRLPIMHDPLTASCLNHDYVKFETVKIRVILNGEKRGSTTLCDEGHVCQIATKVDYEGFNRYLISTLVDLNKHFLSKEKKQNEV